MDFPAATFAIQSLFCFLGGGKSYPKSQRLKKKHREHSGIYICVFLFFKNPTPWTFGGKDKQTSKQASKQTNKQTNKQKNKQTNKQRTKEPKNQRTKQKANVTCLVLFRLFVPLPKCPKCFCSFKSLSIGSTHPVFLGLGIPT